MAEPAPRTTDAATLREAKVWLRLLADGDLIFGAADGEFAYALIQELARLAACAEREECVCGHAADHHDGECFGDRLAAPGSFVPCGCEQFIPAWASWQKRALEAEVALAACAERCETLTAAVATYETAVQRVLAIAPNHWQRYRDPLELGPITEARKEGRAALAEAVPEREPA